MVCKVVEGLDKVRIQLQGYLPAGTVQKNPGGKAPGVFLL